MANTAQKNQLIKKKSVFTTLKDNGTWRSLVAHSAGGGGVEGSNPFVPIFFSKYLRKCRANRYQTQLNHLSLNMFKVLLKMRQGVLLFKSV